MFRTGLVSVTFRKQTPAAVVNLAKAAGLQGIEWGGDVHVPPGDPIKAREVYQMTIDAGLAVAAYGSYHRIGCAPDGTGEFQKVLESAVELQAPTIRVWAGNVASRDADRGWWDRVSDESRRIADLAGTAGISISYEYHRNTLTDTNETAIRLLQEVGHGNVRTYWQPLAELDRRARAEGLGMVGSRLTNLHVFHWINGIRAPLQAGADEWLEYLKLAAGTGDHYALLEFVMNDDEDQFRRDADTLRTLIRRLHKE